MALPRTTTSDRPVDSKKNFASVVRCIPLHRDVADDVVLDDTERRLDEDAASAMVVEHVVAHEKRALLRVTFPPRSPVARAAGGAALYVAA